MLKNDKKISDETVQDKIDLIKAEAIGQVIKNNLGEAQIALTKQDKERMIQQMIEWLGNHLENVSL